MSQIQEKINKLIENRETARLGGGQKAIDKQHDKGKYTARERIQMLLDEGSFEEFDMFVTHRCYDFGMDRKHTFGDGVVTGYGTIDGRLVYVFAQDFTVTAGSLSLSMSDKICKVMDMAMRNGAPCIGMNDSGGARIQEGVNALAGYANIFQRNVMSSGVIPQISAIFGPCAGGAVYSPALTDFIIMKKETSNMFLTGPKVVKTVTGEDVTQEQLGGALMHTTKSGVAQFAVDTEEEGIGLIKKLISYMPQNNMEDAPLAVCTDKITRLEDSLNDIIPDDPNKPYDMMEVIKAIVDNGELLEVDPDEVAVSETIVVKTGERIPLDGIILEGTSTLDTAALTGESLPRSVTVGDEALSGCINQSGLLKIRVTKPFAQSTVSKILELVEEASERKSKSEAFITRFAKYYTPFVVIAAVLLSILPPILTGNFLNGAVWLKWVSRALTFLVISCPCALVISVPLSFFGGIGGASKNGILIKGSNYLEALADVNTIAFDKTGTLTQGTFTVTGQYPANGTTEAQLLEWAAMAEAFSTHPIASSLREAYGKPIAKEQIQDVQEVAGIGVQATIQ